MINYVTAKEAKEIYNLSKATLDKYISNIKENNVIYYSIKDIKEYLNKVNTYVNSAYIYDNYNISSAFLSTCRNKNKIDYIKYKRTYLYNPDKLNDLRIEYLKSKQDSIKNIITDFYEDAGVVCKDFNIDARRISQLLKNGYTKEDIKIATTMLLFNNQKNLYNLKNIIDDAMKEYYWYNHRDDLNTPGYIVKQYYLMFNKFFLRKNFFNECKEIEELAKTNSYESLMNTLLYMKKHDITNFHYIKYNIDKANVNKEQEDLLIYAMQQVKTQQDIEQGTMYFINKTYYNKKLTKFEYAFLINLPLNKDLILIGLEDKKDNFWAFEIDNVSYKKEDLFKYLKQNGVEIDV